MKNLRWVANIFMGLFLSKCRIAEHHESREDLSNKVIILRQQLHEISRRNKELVNNVGILNQEKKQLKIKIKHIDSILSSSGDVADSILLSDLKCKWMDDEKERSYLISIVDFLNVVCSDITCGLYTNPSENECTKKCTKSLLKKMNTIDKPYTELNHDTDAIINDEYDSLLP